MIKYSATLRASKALRFSVLIICTTVVLLFPPSSLASTDLRALALNPAFVSTGIKNLGNTCYMNAQLQCAFHIPHLRQLAIGNEESQGTVLPEDASSEDEEKKDDTEDPTKPTVRPKVEPESDAKIAIRELFSQMLQAAASEQPAVVPRSFCLRLGIPPFVQQDSQEFWKLLLPAVGQESISDLYKGSFEDYITALDGSGRERRRDELFLDLSLDITKSSTLQDSLKEGFGEPELLSVEEGNGWRPEKGADKVDAHKGSSLIAKGLPPILQFHLKRFTYDWQTDNMTKLNTRLAFPAELDLGSICKSTDDSMVAEYDLQSIVIHMGEYGVGHYYAYVRPDVESDIWYRFNDDVVEEVSLEEVFQDAYGGKSSAFPKDSPPEKAQGGGFFTRFLRIFQGKSGGDPYGYGGRSSNAYVLQYVRKSDKSILYPEEACY